MNLVEQDNLSDVKKTKKPFVLKMIWAQIKLGWKLMPRNQLVGGVVGGGFFFLGVGNFIWYAYQLIQMYNIIGYALLTILGLFILLIIVAAIVRKVKDHLHKEKMKKIYEKLRDHKDSSKVDLGQNLIND